MYNIQTLDADDVQCTSSASIDAIASVRCCKQCSTSRVCIA